MDDLPNQDQWDPRSEAVDRPLTPRSGAMILLPQSNIPDTIQMDHDNIQLDPDYPDQQNLEATNCPVEIPNTNTTNSSDG